MSDRHKGRVVEFNVGFGGTVVASGRGAEDSPAGFRILYVGELLPRPMFRASAPGTPTLLPAGRAVLDDTMARLRMILALDVRDPFDSRQPPLAIALPLTGIRAFRPDAWLEGVAPIRSLCEARRVVEQVRAGALAMNALSSELVRILPREHWAETLLGASQVAPEQTSPSFPRIPETPRSGADEAPEGSGGLDALFASVDVPCQPLGPGEDVTPVGLAPSAPRTGFGALITAVAKGQFGAPSAVGPTAPLDAIERSLDAGLTRLIDAILGHEEFRRLERVWRNLRFLSQHVGVGAVLDAVNADASSVSEAIEAASVAPADCPLDLVVVDESLGATAADADRLSAWAGLAARLRLPLVVGGTPEMLGLGDVASIGRSRAVLETAESPLALQLRRVASSEAARWVCVALNSPLLRAAHDAQSARLRGLAFCESDAQARHLFGNPAMIVGALLLDGHGRSGWPRAPRTADESLVADLPVRHVGGDDGIALPLEALVTREVQAEAARAGVVVLACARNHDAALVGRLATFYREDAHGAGRAPASGTLYDQIFAGRAFRTASVLVRALAGENDPATIVTVARAGFDRALGFDGQRPDLDLSFEPAERTLRVRIRPAGVHGVELDEIAVSLQLD